MARFLSGVGAESPRGRSVYTQRLMDVSTPPFRTRRATFTAPGSPFVGQPQSSFCDKGGKASEDFQIRLPPLVF